MTQPHHPIWALLDKLALPLIVGGVIWANASHFDRGELTSVITIVLGSLARDRFLKT